MRTVALLTLAVGCLLAASAMSTTPAQAGGKALMGSKERRMIHVINRRRASHGLPALRASRRLGRAADYHSREMLAGNYFDHDSRNGGSFDDRIRRFATHRAVGETLAMLGGGCGRGSARTVVRMWMHSPGHRAILLSSAYRRIGLGKRVGSLGYGRACVVTADFASRR